MNLESSSAKTYLDLVISYVKGESPIPEFSKKSILPLIDKFKPRALSMCGDKTINHLLSSMQTIDSEKIPGHFIETGVWRGGLTIIMRAFLQSINDKSRKVFVADSFEGLPNPKLDLKDMFAQAILIPFKHLKVSRTEVEKAFHFFGLLDDQVIFLEGWFKDTLPQIEDGTKFSLIRLDGDYYESTRDALEALYSKLSTGGFLIIDDYNLPLGCKRAVDEFRMKNSITEPIIKINGQAVYWRKI